MSVEARLGAIEAQLTELSRNMTLLLTRTPAAPLAAAPLAAAPAPAAPMTQQEALRVVADAGLGAALEEPSTPRSPLPLGVLTTRSNPRSNPHSEAGTPTSMASRIAAAVTTPRARSRTTSTDEPSMSRQVARPPPLNIGALPGSGGGGSARVVPTAAPESPAAAAPGPASAPGSAEAEAKAAPEAQPKPMPQPLPKPGGAKLERKPSLIHLRSVATSSVQEEPHSGGATRSMRQRLRNTFIASQGSTRHLAPASQSNLRRKSQTYAPDAAAALAAAAAKPTPAPPSPERPKAPPAAETESDSDQLEPYEAAPEHLPFVVHQDSLFRQSWDTTVLLAVLWVMIEAPFAAAFQFDLSPGANTLVDVMFWADLALNFVTTYRDASLGVVVRERRAIAHHYVRSGWFFVDLLSCIPFDRFADGPDQGVFKVMRLLRLIRVSKLFKRWDDLLKANALRMLRLLGFIMLIVHWVACAWKLVGDEWADEYWAGVDGGEPEALHTYWTCVYTSASLLFRNVQVSPASDGEKVFSTLLILFGACIQASVFGSVAVLLAGLDEAEMTYNKRVIDVVARMKQLRLPEPLQRRVRAYYDSLWFRQKSIKVDAEEFICELSPALQSDIRICMFRDMVLKIPFLNDHGVGSLVVEALVMALKTAVYLEGDLVIRKGESGDWMGFVGEGGRVAVLDPAATSGNEVLKELGEGEYVGELALVLRVRRTADVVALTFLRLHVLTRQAFEMVKARYPAEARLIEAGLNLTSVRDKYRTSKSGSANDLHATGSRDYSETARRLSHVATNKSQRRLTP